MIIIISSSKTQQVSCAPEVASSQPSLLSHAEHLIELLKKYDRDELAALMKTSDKLTALTAERISNFSLPHIPPHAGTALTTFQGDTFSEIDTQTYSKRDFLWANDHLRILSGLYGILKPLDLIEPYRLEMGTKLASNRGKNLYQFWGEKITESINERLASMKHKIVVNCASYEYSRAVNESLLDGSICTITFKQRKNNMLKSFAIYGKRARGLFVNFMIRQRVESPEDLLNFSDGGYHHTPELSNENELVFTVDLP